MEEINEIIVDGGALSICVFDVITVSSTVILIFVWNYDSIFLLGPKARKELKTILEKESISEEIAREIIRDCYVLAEVVIDEFLERKS